MNVATQETFLTTAVAELPLSPDFKEFAKARDWKSLADIQQHRTGALLQLPGFTEHLLYEYVDLLEAHGLGGLIDP